MNTDVLGAVRTYVRVDLTCAGEWRVGTWRHDDRSGAQDRGYVPTARLRAAAPYLAGSSVRGSLRSHLRQALGTGRVDAVFGPEPPEGGVEDEDTAGLVASPWWVLAADIVADSSGIRTRGQTAIDRWRRAPRRGSFRDAETVVPHGSGPHVRVYLRCDHGGDATRARDVLAALPSWRPRLGGGRSVGLGRARVVGIALREVDLGGRDGLLARLTAGGGPSGLDTLLDDPAATVVTVAPEQPDEVILSAEFEVPDGWLPAVGNTRRDAVDGSTWKGIIRSRVEFISRSLAQPVCGHLTPEGQQWQCGTCDVCDVFGSPVGGGVLEFATTPVQGVGERPLAKRQRSAVDRFTGGVRDGALFGEAREDGVRMRLEIRGAAEIPGWVARAVLHAVRDLAEGLVGLGPRSGGGVGTLSTNSVVVGSSWNTHLASPAGGTSHDGPRILTMAEIAALAVVEVPR